MYVNEKDKIEEHKARSGEQGVRHIITFLGA
jgi:hypothetical protein